MENGKCPHCGCFSLVREMNADLWWKPELCLYCILCGRRFKLSGIRYVILKEEKRRASGVANLKGVLQSNI